MGTKKVKTDKKEKATKTRAPPRATPAWNQTIPNVVETGEAKNPLQRMAALGGSPDGAVARGTTSKPGENTHTEPAPGSILRGHQAMP